MIHFFPANIFHELDLVGRIQTSYAITVINFVVLAAFSVDLILRIIAEGFTPWRFFYDGWQCFDFLIVSLCYVFLAPSLSKSRSIIAMLRLLRLLRVLKLVKALPELRVVVEAVMSGFRSVFFFTLMMYARLSYLIQVLSFLLLTPQTFLLFPVLSFSTSMLSLA